MPKQIPNAREKILISAKKLLLGSETGTFSIRQVASDSGIAAGTIYNYYPDKTALLVSVMMEDWEKSLACMDEKIGMAETGREAVCSICTAIRSFASCYHEVWKNYDAKGVYFGTYGVHHIQLRNEIVKRLNAVNDRFGRKENQEVLPVLAEAVIQTGIQKDLRVEQLGHLAQMLFEKEGE